MFTIKACAYRRNDDEAAKSMTMYSADKVEVLDLDNCPKVIRLHTFAALHGLPENVEVDIVMDVNCRNGPGVVFVENLDGKTVQRISTDIQYLRGSD